ncbi:MAG: HDOD domain-containing protein [Methylophilaceae bacterium]|jgi:two-component system cell cycle response regulator
MTETLDFSELKAAGMLPSPKGVALRVMHLCQEETVSLTELASAIQTDPALSGRIIKIANYVNPNKSRPIASVTIDTLILIGIHAVRQAVLCMSLISNYRDGPCKLFDYEYFWSTAIAKANAAQAISQLNRVAPPAEIFNAGLMCGIGQLALVTARPASYGEILQSLPAAPVDIIMQAELERFGLNQRDMLVLMLQDWGIPRLFIDAMYYHEDPISSGFPENSRMLRLTYTLQLSALLAHACIHGQEDPALIEQLSISCSMLDIDREQLELLLEQTSMNWMDWAKLLNVQTRRYNPRPLMMPPIKASPLRSEPVMETVQPATVALRILLVGADDSQRILLGKFLTAAGHSVTTTDNGLTAFGMATHDLPQVIISDWLMPGMDGLKLCSDLRKVPAGSKLYFILLTPFEDERRKMEAYEAGVDEILRTPINTRLLAARLLAAQRIANPNANPSA